MPSKYQRKSRIKEPYKKIIIAMEGNRTEPAYFRAIKRIFSIPTLEIIPLTRDDSDTRSAPQHVIGQLHDYKKNNRIDKTDEFWLIIDKDRWRDVQLSEVAADCTVHRYKMALSNPCFEIWLILHFQDIETLPVTDKNKLIHGDNVKAYWSNIHNSNRISGYSQIVAHVDKAVIYAEKLDIDKSLRWMETIGSRIYQLINVILQHQ